MDKKYLNCEKDYHIQSYKHTVCENFFQYLMPSIVSNVYPDQLASDETY